MREGQAPYLAWVTAVIPGARAVAVAAVLATATLSVAAIVPAARANETAHVEQDPQFHAAATAPAAVEIASTPLSPECRCKGPAHEGAHAFRRIDQAMRERRSARVLAIGSSSTVGVGASQPAATFTVQLEADLERAFKGADFDIIARGVSGEVAAGTAARIRAEAIALKPDLIVWQVGTNDGVAHVDQAVFAALLTSTLRWLTAEHMDVVLIDPQYVGKFAADDHYKGIVRTVADVARRERVPLVRRYLAMEDLARTQINRSYMASDLFHLNDLGYKCMAEFAAQAIETGVRQAVAEGNLDAK